jgi:hypothetical protein
MYIWCISALAGIVTYNAINNVEMPLDDVIDIPWRMKLVLPAIASMPLEFETSRIDIGSMFIELGIQWRVFK